MLKITGCVYVQETGEDSVRCDTNADEHVDVPQSEIDGSSGAQADRYGPKRGTVKISLAAATALPEEVTLFFTEHRSQNRKQHQIKARPGKEVSVDLPSGDYTMQILARGFETVRGLAEVDPTRPFKVDAALKPRKKKARTFEERLAKYGIDAARTEIVDLNVRPDSTVALNHRNDRQKRGFKMLETDAVATIKQWVGSDDERFGHDRPVYGRLPDPKPLSRLRDDGVDLHKLEPAEIQAVMSIAREYVQGNSRAVAMYEPLLNEAIKATVIDGMSRFPIYFYRVVTIGAGATLEIGSGSAIFACDELRIHKTGKLKPVANVSIEIGTYTEFQ